MMRHSNSGRKLNMKSGRRTSLFRGLATALIDKEIIKTTLPRAKEMRSFVEPLITLSKSNTLSARRLAFSRIRDRKAVVKLFDELGPRFRDRPGGYLRILKCGFRPGDAAPMAYVELVDRSVD